VASTLGNDDFSRVHDALWIEQLLHFLHPVNASLALRIMKVLGLVSTDTMLGGYRALETGCSELSNRFCKLTAVSLTDELVNERFEGSFYLRRVGVRDDIQMQISCKLFRPSYSIGVV
jgi:hypothetical protein